MTWSLLRRAPLYCRCKDTEPTKNLSLSGAFGYTQPADANHIVAAPGHIWTPQAEQVVYARRPNNGTDLHVTFVADPPTGGPSQVLPNLAPRFPTSADFMDIAAGDLINHRTARATTMTRSSSPTPAPARTISL